jgi:HlyD family secretion protein
MKAIKVFLIVIFLTVVGFIVYRSFTKNKKESEYKTVSLEQRDISETIFIPGNVFPAKEIEIKSQLSGILENISVKIGDSVKIGSPIASIRLVPNTADIERFENNLNLAQIEHDALLVEYNRAKRLSDTKTITEIEMNDAERVYLLSKERLVSAKNQLDILKKGKVLSKNISNIVSASTAGTVIDIPFETGASVIERNNYNAGTTIALIAETDIFKFRTLVAEQYLKYLTLGDTVNLIFNAYESLIAKAVITKISSKGNLENGIMKYMMDAEFAITPEMPVLRSGYSATAEIILDSREKVMSIEEKHIIFENDSSYVFVLTEKDRIKKRIDLGISDGIYTEITGGITINEKIVTNHDKTD